jgi:hypothetical protein
MSVTPKWLVPQFKQLARNMIGVGIRNKCEMPEMP